MCKLKLKNKLSDPAEVCESTYIPTYLWNHVLGAGHVQDIDEGLNDGGLEQGVGLVTVAGHMVHHGEHALVQQPRVMLKIPEDATVLQHHVRRGKAATQ